MKFDNRMIAIIIGIAMFIYVYYNDTSQNHQTSILVGLFIAFVIFMFFRKDERKIITMREARAFAKQWMSEMKAEGTLENVTISPISQCCLYREKGQPLNYWIGFKCQSGKNTHYVVVIDAYSGDITRFKDTTDWTIEDKKDIEIVVLPEAQAGIKLISDMQGKTVSSAEGDAKK